MKLILFAKTENVHEYIPRIAKFKPTLHYNHYYNGGLLSGYKLNDLFKAADPVFICSEMAETSDRD